MTVSAVSYGGIVSAGYYDHQNYPEWDQAASDRYVSWAIDRGVNYFDVAPSYGNAEEQLGNSLRPYRNEVHLACKTLCRDRASAEAEMENSMKLLHTDHFDVYQLHEIFVAAENAAGAARFAALTGNGCDNVICFVAVALEDGDAEGFENFADPRHLGVQVFRSFRAVGLILVVHFVTEGFCFTIHSGYYVAWLVMLEYIMEVSEKAEDG